jgi:hypothetical protein
MSQLFTLVWLKWRLLRNSLRSSKAVVNKAASILGVLLALLLSLVVASVLGIIAYVLSQPGAFGHALRRTATGGVSAAASAEFVFFSILGILYLMWATVPLSIGGTKQFDAGKLLMYPITLRKLFAVDYISELTTLQSVFAVPAVLAICIGAGLGSGRLAPAVLAAAPALLFGIALSKWLSTTLGSLVRRKRAKGETIVALIGAVAGLGVAAAGQIAPILFKHVESIRWLRWTPPGATAFLLIGEGATDSLTYTAAFLTLSAYAVALIVGTYLIARRAALGFEGRKRRKRSIEPVIALEGYSGWQLPFVSGELSAVFEKEIRYAMRNAQIRMLAVMPLILIIIRLLNHQGFESTRHAANSDFLMYGSGLLATGGVLYVFLFLAGISCNEFSLEEGGMRTLILSPIDRRKILLGKNIALTVVAAVFSTFLLLLNLIVFQDLTAANLLFVALSFVIFAAISLTIGNWLSIYFPKRMQFGKRMNVSGVAGVLLIPMIIVLGLPPLFATLVGYLTQSLLNEYIVLAVLALMSVGLYFAIINLHGRSLAKREIDILEAVREPTDE